MRFALKSCWWLGLLIHSVAFAESLVGVDFGGAIRFFDSTTPGTLGIPTPLPMGSGEVVQAIDTFEEQPGLTTLFVWVAAPGQVHRLIAFDPHQPSPDPVQFGGTHVITGATQWGLTLSSGGETAFLVSNAGHNLHISLVDGTRTHKPDLAFAGSDPNAGVTPKVGALVQVAGAFYGVDAATTSWVRLDPLALGTVNTIAPLALGENLSQSTVYNLIAKYGQVFLSVGELQPPGISKLYSVDPATGSATLLGAIEGNTILHGLGVDYGPVAPPQAEPLLIWDAGRDLARNEKPDLPTAWHDDRISVNSRVPEWSYGNRFDVATTNLTLYPPAVHTNNDPGIYADAQGFDDGGVHVYANVGTLPITVNNGFGPLLPLRPAELWLHPSSNHRFSVIRWTCPFEREFQISAYWEDMDPYGGNGCSTHIVVNGTEVYQHTYANGGTSSTNLYLYLHPGDQVDFLLGTNGEYTFDAARANFTVSAAPRDLAWNGGSGSTGVDANWNPSFLPQRLDTVRIETGSPRADAELNALHLINSSDVTFTNGWWNIYGSLTNDGSLRVGEDRLVFHGNIGLYGEGNLFLAGGSLDTGDRDLDTFFNLGNRIQGYGSIPARFNNQSNGVVTVNNHGTLVLSQPVANHGTMTATADSLLLLTGEHAPLGPLHNGDGVIRALFDGKVFLAGPVSGGRLENQQNDPGPISGASVFNPEQVRELSAAGVFLGGIDPLAPRAELSDQHGFVTLEGTDLSGNPAEFTLLPGRDLALASSLLLNGVLRTYGNTDDGASTIHLLQDVLINGSGGIELGWAGRDDTLVGSGRTLYLGGSQRLAGGGQVHVSVFSGGLLMGDRSSATAGTYPLVFHKEVTNLGFALASQGGTLRLHDRLVQWTETGETTGTVFNATGGRVEFDGATVVGGLLSQTEGEAAFTYHHSGLDGEQSPSVMLRGLHDAGGQPNDSLALLGNLDFQSATLSLLGPCTATATAFTHLQGSGLVWLRHYPEADLEVPGGEQLFNSIAIAGQGEIRGSGTLLNQASGNLQAFGGTLHVYPESLLNAGLIETGGRPADGQADVAGLLYLGGEVVNGGTIRVNNALSSLVLYQGRIAGGTVETLGDTTGFVLTSGGLEGVRLRNNLRVAGDTRCDLAGTLEFLPGLFSDSYLVAGGSAGEVTEMAVEGTVTLEGLGGIWLRSPSPSDPSLARIIPADHDAGTTERIVLREGARLRGHGMVSVRVHNESGEILADTPGQALQFMPGTLETGDPVATFDSDQILADPDIVLPATGVAVARAVNEGILQIGEAVIANQRFVVEGPGKLVWTAVNPVLNQVRVALRGTSEMVMTNGVTLLGGFNLSVLGNQAPALPGTSNCGIPHADLGNGPTLRLGGALVGNAGNTLVGNNGNTLIGEDGASIVAAGGGNVISHNGGQLSVSGKAAIVAAGAGNMVAAGAGNVMSHNGGALVARDGGSMVAAGGLNLVAADGGNLVAAGGGNLVAAGGGNLVAAGGGNLVAAGGGNLANTATGNMVAAGGLNGGTAYGILQVQPNGRLRTQQGNVYVDGGNRSTTMMENQASGRMDITQQSCIKVPQGRFQNAGTLNASQSNLVTAFFSNVGNAVVSGVTWAWNGAVGAVTGFVNGVGGVLNATGSFFSRLVGGAGQPGDGGGFALVGGAVMSPSDFINEGTLLLGDGITTNTLAMGFTQTNTGTLSVQLGGTDAEDYDRLFIHGPAVLGGVLQLVFTNRFAPTLGDTFDFLVSPDFTGDFDAVEIAGLPAGHDWQFHATFTNGAYRIVSDSTVTWPPSPLDDFRALHGLAADGSQDFANPAGDGVPNLFKYAFNIAPQAGDLLTANARLLAHATDTAGLPRLLYNPDATFSYLYVRRRAESDPRVVYTAQIDTSLTGTWNPLTGVAETVERIDDHWERVRLDLGSPLPAPYSSGAYLRVQVVPAP